ncbi:MAG: sensor histidine kinase [Planctomyces sp.]
MTGLALAGTLWQNALDFCQDDNIGVMADPEAHVFLIRSIRRRLILLFSVALGLILLLGGAGLQGLLWHLEAVDDLDFLLHESPDQDKLSRAVSRIGESLHTRRDPRKPGAAEQLQQSCAGCIQTAQEELFEFRRRIEHLPFQNEEDLRQREIALGRLDAVYGELYQLRQLNSQISGMAATAELLAFRDLQHRCGLAISQIQRTLETLPAWQTRHWLQQSQKREHDRSATLLKIVSWSTAVGIVVFLATLTAALRWISGPLREIARGCTRIANGDTSYRLAQISKVQDEFADVVAGVNCMADRFQQSEEDLQQKVRERSDQLLRSQRLANVGFLAAGVAHEINNPLSAISMAAETVELRLCQRDDADSQEAKEILRRVAMIRRESLRCGAITARLLDFSRADRAVRSTVDLAQLIREVLDMVRHLGQFSDRTIEFECERVIMAEVSEAQIRQVILNLVANGLQATDAGGRVCVRLTEQVDNVVVAVEDNGCGMDHETQQQVFDPFFSNQQSGRGTGLGLSIIHRIVEDHGGTVTPFSAGAGQGSTFQVRLPRRARRSAAA